MQGMKGAAKRINEKFEAGIVGSLSRRWRTVGPEVLDRHSAFIRQHYIHPSEYWDTEGGKADMRGLTIDRLYTDRRKYIPWINSFLPLQGATILEIGSGTGSSTVALAEQGAIVTGVDILEEGIAVAKEKCRIFGVQADLAVGNFLDYAAGGGERFDAVIFFAALEHMLIEERMQALPLAWNLIRPGGYLIVIEAPNRLWKFDDHTSRLPFFNWLPRELALQYIQFSPRAELVRVLTPASESTLLELQRWGLGVSFHEFDLSLGRDARNSVCSSLGPFLRRRSPFRRIGWHVTGEAKFSRILGQSAPDVSDSWFEPYLNLAIQRRG